MGDCKKKRYMEHPEVIAEHKNIPCWNPVLFKVAPDRIMLFYKCGKEIATWKTMYKISDDSGETVERVRRTCRRRQRGQRTCKKSTDPSEKWKDPGSGIS